MSFGDHCATDDVDDQVNSLVVNVMVSHEAEPSKEGYKQFAALFLSLFFKLVKLKSLR